MATLKEIEERADRLRQKMLAVLEMTDAQQIMDTAEALKVEATELEKDGREWAAKIEAQQKSARGRFEVVLTEQQQQRIRQVTGVHMRTVIIEDSSGRLNSAMPGTQRLAIEKIALEQARAMKARQAAEANAREAALQNIAELESQGGDMAELVAMIKEEPDFRRILCLDKK